MNRSGAYRGGFALCQDSIAGGEGGRLAARDAVAAVEAPGDHTGKVAGVGTFAGKVRVVLDSGFVDVDLATVVEVLT